MFPMLVDSRKLSQVLANLCEAHGPIYQMNILLKRTIVTSDADDLLQVFSSREEFARLEALRSLSEYVVPNSLFTMEMKQHDFVRKSIRDNFKSKQLEKYHESMSAAIKELCVQLDEKLSENNADKEFSSDLVDLVALVTFRSIISVALGSSLDLEGRLDFADKVNKLVKIWMNDILIYPLGEILAPFGARKKLDEYNNACFEIIAAITDQRIQDHESNAKPSCIDENSDLLDVLISLFKDDRKTLLSQVFFLTGTGAHTVTQVISWLMFYICKYPEIYTRMLEEIDQVDSTASLSHADLESKFPFTKAAWNETLRLNPPVAISMKMAGRGVKLRGSGICVPKGTPVFGFAYFTHRLERYWKNPLDFNPDRWIDAKAGTVRRPPGVPAGAFLPYGAGQRSCLGSFFADYEGVSIIIELLRQYEFKLECDPSEVISCSDFVESIAHTSQGGVLHMGLPVRISHRRRGLMNEAKSGVGKK